MYNSFLYDNRVRNEQQRRDSSAKFKAWEKKHNGMEELIQIVKGN